MQMLSRPILQVLGVQFPKNLPYPMNPNVVVGFFNGFALWHQNYYYTLNGKFPAKHADILWNCGHSQTLKIREAGMGDGCDPTPWITSDYYEELSSRIVLEWWEGRKVDPKKYPETSDEMDARMMALKETMRKNAPDTFYLSHYHIDTEDGLVFMLNYIKENEIKTNWGYL